MAFSILFVYNVDSTTLQESADLAVSIITPHVDRCGLYKITHNQLGRRVEWTTFLGTLKPPCRFLCRDEFMVAYPHMVDAHFPSIYIEDYGELLHVADSYAIYACDTARGLGELVEAECQRHRSARRSQG